MTSMPAWPGHEPPDRPTGPPGDRTAREPIDPEQTTQPIAAEPERTLFDPGGPATRPYPPHQPPAGEPPLAPGPPIPSPPVPRPPVSGPPPGTAGPHPQRLPGVNTMAIAALFFSIFIPPVGILMGHIAKSQIRRTGESGKGLATTALLIGYGLLLCVCGGVILLLPVGL